MRLAVRLIAFVVVILAALVVVDGWDQFNSDNSLLRDGMKEQIGVLGAAVSGMLHDVWVANGMDRALEEIADTNAVESGFRMRWVWLDAEGDDPYAPGVLLKDAVAASLGTGAVVDGPTADEARLYGYFPVATPTPRAGALEISRSTAELSQRALHILGRSAVRLAAVFLIGALAVYVIGLKLIGRPLEKLDAKIRRVGKGDLSEPLELRGSHELSQLAACVNTMCQQLLESQARVAEETAARIAAIEQARHADRLRTVGQLASGVAHELGTPLNVVSGRAGLIAEAEPGEALVKESAEIIVAQANRMAQIIRQLLVFARRSTSEREPVDVGEIARQTAGLLEASAKKRDITVAVRCEPAGGTGAALAECRASALQQVLTNLILNAVQASAPGGTVAVEVGREDARPTDEPEAPVRPCIRVEVRDWGEGISPEHLPHIFEPFFTTKEVGTGTGLGLSIVHGILHDFGGWIRVVSEPGAGSCFVFHIPVSAGPEVADDGREAER